MKGFEGWEFLFLGIEFTGTVIGFLDKDQYVTMNWDTYDTNKLFILPYSNNINFEAYEDNVTYYIFKNYGYIVCKNKIAFLNSKKDIEKVSSEYNLYYTLLKGY